MRIRYSMSVVVVAACTFVSNDSSAQTWQAAAERVRSQEFTLRPTTEGRQKIYLPVEPGAEDAFALFRRSRLFPLRSPEPVRATKADSKDDHIEIEMTSARLGRGRIDIYGAPPSPETLEQWLDEIFEIRTPDDEFARYIGNRESRVLHLRHANHLPGAEAREPYREPREATSQGYRLCGVCFMPVPDVSDYQTEQALAMMALQQPFQKTRLSTD